MRKGDDEATGDDRGGNGDNPDDGHGADANANSDGGSFKVRRRSNDTYESTTDGDARLYRKGKTASELRYMGHTLSDNPHGLVANAVVTLADG